jgi:hypothetical protein
VPIAGLLALPVRRERAGDASRGRNFVALAHKPPNTARHVSQQTAISKMTMRAPFTQPRSR